ncbi:hypothetical protein NBRC116493_09210 [Aurantivibrio infirmus]
MQAKNILDLVLMKKIGCIFFTKKHENVNDSKALKRNVFEQDGTGPMQGRSQDSI